MQCSVEPKELEEVAANNILTQDPIWADIKSRQGAQPLAFEIKVSDELLNVEGEENKFHTEDLIVYLYEIGASATFAYVPYGPNLLPEEENYGFFLETLSERIKSQLPETCIFIRYDLPWENLWSKEDTFYDENNYWKGPPENKTQEYRLNWNTEYGKLLKSRTDNLPSNTFFVDLRQGEEEILAQMKPKTRYNIRLSQRKGVEVQQYGIEMLDEWYALYAETTQRNGMQLQDKEFFKTVIEAEGRGVDSDVQLLMASYKGEMLAAMIFVISNRRATYLYGASTAKHRGLMAPYCLQWEAIQRAKKAGCVEYDMFGTSPHPYPSHPMAGLFRFKHGFGAELFHRMGCWDYPLMEQEYKIYRAKEIQAKSFHNN
ncbi:FemAB family protein [Lishizhenia tianjinensis]|uniref:FemAB family protein n=1 Tax=Lishizhenia tianjinensis TaxID=477690 RepID=A0A1I6XKR9_9FLAO|nr:peptidoglycan bridge formation glycyltransferase FemA/FemB family protein [Lishizhenia tianjinensis]SFT38958.1 FemAB family protein [Lishizhenia tianjinensis]